MKEVEQRDLEGKLAWSNNLDSRSSLMRSFDVMFLAMLVISVVSSAYEYYSMSSILGEISTVSVNLVIALSFALSVLRTRARQRKQKVIDYLQEVALHDARHRR